jgi:NAD(P)-dependent dehydrogenase (short-subunit alcohol dehydrogenase family)
MGKNTYWIIGGGRFGLRAAEILGHHGAAEIVVIDHDRERCRELADRGLRTECTDGIRFLTDHLTRPDKHLWVVAAAPVHVACLWLRARLSETARLEAVPVPAEVARRLPNAAAGGEGDVFASNADFICPPDCAEVGRICTATGRVRPRSMHAFIRRLTAANVKILVIRSFQLAAGVGGLRPADFFSVLADARSSKGSILLATACKCHAVISAFKMISER